jgi:sulfur-oxidizing protein SoxZ
MASALINVPKKAKRGDIIEIKTLMSHIMETGYRHTATGEVVPRDIITSFSCRYNGVEIFRADLFPAIAANPFITFFTVATASGKADRGWHRRCAARRDRDPAGSAPIRLQLHDAGHPGDAGRRYRQSRHAVGARRRSLVEE